MHSITLKRANILYGIENIYDVWGPFGLTNLHPYGQTRWAPVVGSSEVRGGKCLAHVS